MSAWHVRLPLFVLLAVICCAAYKTTALAAEERLVFSTPEKKQIYRKLTQEMRCLKCQNQNLADSPAGLAEDLKREIFLMVEEGRTAAYVTDFMVSRYGDFILYKPSFKPLTLVLWLAPFVLMLLGLFTILKMTKGRDSSTEQTDGAQPQDSETLEEARHLLHQAPDITAQADAVASTDHSSAR